MSFSFYSIKKNPNNLFCPPPADNFDLSISFKDTVHILHNLSPIQGVQPEKIEHCFSSHTPIAGSLPTLCVLECMWQRQEATHQYISKIDYFYGQKHGVL